MKASRKVTENFGVDMDPELLPALRREAHAWLTFPELVCDPARVACYRTWLSREEQRRYRRFHLDCDRHIYLTAHTLVRLVLSRYVEVSPQAWTFERNAYGRPEIVSFKGLPSLRFNLSHTHGLVACVVTQSIDCGVDVEVVRPLDDPLALAEHFFAPQEIADLRRQSETMLHRQFFKYWTLKEAYLKARGTGLSQPTERFSFYLDRRNAVRIDFAVVADADAAAWQFALMRPTLMHELALALHRGARPDRSIVQRIIEL